METSRPASSGEGGGGGGQGGGVPDTVKPPIKDTPKEDKTSQQRTCRKYSCIYTLYRKSPLKEDNLSTKDKMAGPEGVLMKRFHCTIQSLKTGSKY